MGAPGANRASSTRKTDSRSKLEKLPVEQQAQVCSWMIAGVSYAEIKTRLLADPFNLSVGERALSRFFTATVLPSLVERRRRVVALGDILSTEAERCPAKMRQATLDAIQQKSLIVAADPNSNPRDVKDLFGLLIQYETLKQKDEAIRLDRDKFETSVAERLLTEALRKRAEEIANSALSNEDKIKEMRKAAFRDVDALEASGQVVIPTE